MALDEVLNAGKRYARIRGVDESLRNDPYDPDAFEGYFGYLNDTAAYQEGFDNDEERMAALSLMSDDMQDSPLRFRRNVRRDKLRETQSLLETMDNNYSDVINDINVGDENGQRAVEALLLTVPNEDKDYTDLISYLREHDSESIRNYYSNNVEHDAWRSFIENASPSTLKKLANMRIDIRHKKWLEDRGFVDGDNLDYRAAKNWLANQKDEFSDEDKVEWYPRLSAIYESYTGS
ncbi:MAG: hypothetical protein ACP5D2_04855 [Candidatus Nanoarchaeia archaeon]